MIDKNKNFKKQWLIGSGIFLLLIGLFFWHDSPKEIVIVKVDYKSYKMKPEHQPSLLNSKNNQTIYNKFTTKSDAKKNVNLLPEPEQPLNIALSERISEDVFSLLQSERNSSEHTELQFNDYKTKIQEGNSIWEDMDEALGKNIPANYNNTKIMQNTTEEVVEKSLNSTLSNKTLTITNIASDENNNSNQLAKVTNYHAQVAYCRTEAEAKEEWAKLLRSHKKQLEKYVPVIVQDAGSSKGFYQLLIGSFNNFKDAKQLCRQLTQAKLNCIVSKD